MLRSVFRKPSPQSQVIIYSKRQYGDPKLKKPKELKGIRQLFSIEWIPKKCRCACFIHNNDLYIKHRDFDSIEVYGSDYEFRERFVYKDTFGCVVLRGEAWILIKDFMLDIQNNVFEPILFTYLAEQVTGELGNCDWERFFEKIIKAVKSYCK